MVRPCVTHHHACDCREERFAQLEADLAAVTAERDKALTDAARADGDVGAASKTQDFYAGVRAAFDYLKTAAANNYNGDPEIDKICQIESKHLDTIAEEMLYELHPSLLMEWRSLTKTRKSLRETEARLAEVEGAWAAAVDILGPFAPECGDNLHAIAARVVARLAQASAETLKAAANTVRESASRYAKQQFYREAVALNCAAELIGALDALAKPEEANHG